MTGRAPGADHEATRPDAAARTPTPAASLAASSTVAIVITTFNDARFLPDALTSAFAQDRPPDEVIVVDDGSTENPADIVSQFPGARLIRQENKGQSVARNTGLLATSVDFVAFLDADDVLLPGALSAGLACMAGHPDAAFVYGSYVFSDETLRPFGHVGWFRPCGGDAFATILLANTIGMHATVLYRREILEKIGGFDPSLRKIEDYDVFLRIARDHAVASYPEVVALYRRHANNMTRDAEDMLRVSVAVQDAHRPGLDDRARQRAWAEGRDKFRNHYTKAGLRRLATDALPGRSPAETWSGIRRLYALWTQTRPAGRGLVRDQARFGGHLLTQFLRGAAETLLPNGVRHRLRRLRTRAKVALQRAAPGAASRPMPVGIAPDSGLSERGDQCQALLAGAATVTGRTPGGGCTDDPLASAGAAPSRARRP